MSVINLFLSILGVFFLIKNLKIKKKIFLNKKEIPKNSIYVKEFLSVSKVLLVIYFILATVTFGEWISYGINIIILTIILTDMYNVNIYQKK